MSESPVRPAPSVCYITPTYGGDIERFALLRESISLFSPDIKHIAYVHTEDCAAFERRFGRQSNLAFCPTSDVLSPILETRRQRPGKRLSQRFADKFGGPLGLRADIIPGWLTQQVVKLEALARADVDAVVFLDSDLVLCGPVSAHDHFVDGKLILLEARATNYEDYAFEISRQIIMGGNLLETADAFNYVHVPPRFLSRTASNLITRLRSKDALWQERIVSQQFLSEYNLLGYLAREVERYDGYHVDRHPENHSYSVKAPSDLAVQIQACRDEGGARKFFQLQSNLSIPAEQYVPKLKTLMLDMAKRG